MLKYCDGGKMAKHLRVVTAVIFKGKQILICKRNSSGSFADYYEFPGGKVEGIETDIEALKREIKEELAIEVDVENVINQTYFEYSDFTLDLITYRVNCYKGEIQLRVHSELKWIKVNELSNYCFPPANNKIIKCLEEKYGS